MNTGNSPYSNSIRTQPLVSVVIPCHNSSEYIRDTIKSVLAQDYENFEIIAVDDGSDDATPEILSSLAAGDKRIRVYSIPGAGRPSVPRNFGIRQARGEFTAFLDSDDLWRRNKLSDQVNYMQSHPDAVFVYSMSVTFGKVSVLSPNYEVLPLKGKAALSYEDLISKGNSVTCSSVLIRTEFLKKAGGFDEDPLLQIEDYDLWIRLSRMGPIGFMPRIHVYYRVHAVQFSGSWEIKKQRLEYLSQKLNVPLPEYKFARNRGIFVRLLRNAVHYANYTFALGSEWFERLLSRNNRAYDENKILMITARADFGGGPEHLFRLLQNLSPEYSVYIACPEEYPYWNRFRDIIGETGLIRIPHRKFALRTFFALADAIRKNHIGIIHSHGKGAGIYSRLLAMYTGRKCVHTFHGIHLANMNPVFRFVYILIERFLSLFTTNFISVSESERQTVLSHRIAPCGKISVIHNAVDVPADMAGKDNFYSVPRMITSVTRLDFAKNPELLIDIAAELNKAADKGSYRIEMLGPGFNDAAFLNKVQQNEAGTMLSLPGTVDAPQEYLLKSFCYISTSKWEGLPLGVMEAMACGLPVIATDVTGNRDLVSHGETGFLYNISDPARAAGYILQLAGDPVLWQKMSAAARQYAEKHFSLRTMAGLVEKIYSQHEFYSKR
ncbi:MAG: glycosyltransferase [Bacteroidota bacterium]